MERLIIQVNKTQCDIPSWAKAENMEMCIPRTELWKWSKENNRFHIFHEKLVSFFYKKSIIISISSELYANLHAQATKDGVTVNQYITKLLDARA
jgi:hypothetical protein